MRPRPQSEADEPLGSFWAVSRAAPVGVVRRATGRMALRPQEMMTMARGEQVVKNSVSRFGLHQLHVIRMGGPVDVEAWVTETAGGWDFVKAWWVYEEVGIGVHHLRLYW